MTKFGRGLGLAFWAIFWVAEARPALGGETKTRSDALSSLTDFAGRQGSSSLLVLHENEVILELYWELKPEGFFSRFMYPPSKRGHPREDVASIQKSVVALLALMASERDLFDIDVSVSRYLGPGWSGATQAKEARITVRHLMNMSSGLSRKLEYVAPPLTQFEYNTRGYVKVVEALQVGAGQPLEALSREWLIKPLGLEDSGWEKRGFPTTQPLAWVASARDLARLGQLILNGGTWQGKQLISRASLKEMFQSYQKDNPSYGLYWWLNGEGRWENPQGRRFERDLIPAAPADTLVALGRFGRYLCISPSAELILVRMGKEPEGYLDNSFIDQLWQSAMQTLADE